MKEAGAHLKSQTNTYEALPGPSNLRAADNSGVTEGPAQEGMDCEVAAFHNFHNYSLPCTSCSPGRSISSLSTAIDMEA